MKILLSLFLVFICCFKTVQVHAQEWEVGGWAGVTNYFGDLNQDFNFEYMGLGAGAMGRYNINYRFAAKSALSYGRIAFEDRANKQVYAQVRNLSFRSPIIEWSNQIEFNFFKFDKMRDQFNFTPYLLAGISVFYFNPVAVYQGKSYDLQPLGTEGQQQSLNDGKRAYSRVNAAFVAGGGLKYAFTPLWTLGLEIGVRATFTDFLDDVSTVYPGLIQNGNDAANGIANGLSDRSAELGDPVGFAGKQRGDDTRNDLFLTMGFTITRSIIKVKCPKPGKSF